MSAGRFDVLGKLDDASYDRVMSELGVEVVKCLESSPGGLTLRALMLELGVPFRSPFCRLSVLCILRRLWHEGRVSRLECSRVDGERYLYKIGGRVSVQESSL